MGTPEPTGAAAPVIKYPGGKKWAIPIVAAQIRDHVLADGDRRLVDPFMGGGAIPLWCGVPALVGDFYKPLAELYQVLQEKPGELVWNLSALAMRGVDEKTYYAVRERRPKTAMARAARFLYLNRLCFNGVTRENEAGEFNVPYAKETWRKSTIERCARDAVESLWPNKEKFHFASRALERAEIHHADFSELVTKAKPGDLVIFDPPYIKTRGIYTAKEFNMDDHGRLARVIREADARGVLVLGFNTDCKETRSLYPGMEFYVAQEKRQINSNIKGRHRVKCVIITNAPQLVDVMALRRENTKGKAAKGRRERPAAAGERAALAGAM